MKRFVNVSKRLLAALLVLIMLGSVLIACGLPIAAEGVQQSGAEEAEIPNVSGDNSMKAEDNDFMIVMAVTFVVIALLAMIVFSVLGYWVLKAF